MKVIKNQLSNIIKNATIEGLPDKELTEVIRYIFSFEENIEVFGEFFFEDVFCNKTPKFHEEIYDEMFKDEDSALAAPRGHAKSSAVGLNWLIFCVVNLLYTYIVYISSTGEKTRQFVDPIRYNFKNNKLLRWVYGDLTPKNTKDDDGKDREDMIDIGKVKIQAVSFEKNMRGFKDKYGKRPDLIVLDDIESDEWINNPEQRLKYEMKFKKVIIPSLDINGHYKMIGTILHVSSILSKQIKLLKGKIYKACTSDFKNILWPDRFTEAKLRDKHFKMGSIAFQQEFLNNPSENMSSIIPRKLLDLCRRDDLSLEDCQAMKFEQKGLGVDFAFSDAVSGDDTSYFGLGLKDNFKYIIWDESAHGKTALQQMNHIKYSIQKKMRFDIIGLEENSIKAISGSISDYNLPIKLFWTGSNDEKEKTKEKARKPNKATTIGKTSMIMRIATEVENGLIIIPYKTEADKVRYEQLCAELTTFSLVNGKLVETGIHSDRGIGLGMALECFRLNTGGII